MNFEQQQPVVNNDKHFKNLSSNIYDINKLRTTPPSPLSTKANILGASVWIFKTQMNSEKKPVNKDQHFVSLSLNI